MDLTQQPPRRPSNLSILSIANLARMADKARATRDETEGDYIYGMESGLDETLLLFLGISEEDFADAAERYGDTELGEWVSRAAGKTPDEIAGYNNDLLNRTPQSEGSKQRLKERVDKFAPGRTDIKTIVQSLELEDWGNFRDVNLTKRPPKTPYDRSVAGIYAVARMADKARAAKTDTLNGYIYNCPIDMAVLSFLGLSAEDFQEAAWQNPNAIELGDWIHAHSPRTASEIAQFNYIISHKSPDDDRGKAIFQKTLDRVAPGRIDITTWFDLLDLDDEHDYGLVDLTRHAPRSPYDSSVMGILGLARLIDKGRAMLTHTIGGYFYGQDSGLDRQLLSFLGTSADDFKNALKTCVDDHAVVAWLKTKTQKSETEIATFNTDIAMWEPSTDRQKAFLTSYMNKIAPDRSDVTCFAAMVQLDDQITFAKIKAGV